MASIADSPSVLPNPSHTARRIAAILSGLVDAHHQSDSARDGYCFDTAVATLVQQYAYPPLPPCSLLSYRQVSRWQFDEQTHSTTDMYSMQQQLTTLAAAYLPQQHQQDSTVEEKAQVQEGKDEQDEDERCRRSIRQHFEQLALADRRYVGCIAGESFNFNQLRASCSPPASLPPPYYTYFVVAEQHDLDYSPTEAALCEWLLKKYERFGGKRGDSEIGDGSILASIEAVCQALGHLVMFGADEVTMTLFCSAQRLDAGDGSDKQRD